MALLSVPVAAVIIFIIRRVLDAFKHAGKTLMTLAFFLFLGLGRYRRIVGVFLCFTVRLELGLTLGEPECELATRTRGLYL